MKIYRSVTIDIETGETVAEDSYEYTGPVALCGGGGDDGGASDSEGGFGGLGIGNPGSYGGDQSVGAPGFSGGYSGAGGVSGGAEGGAMNNMDIGAAQGYGGFGGLGIGNPGSYQGQQSVGAPGFSGGYSGAGGVSGYTGADYGKEALGAIYNGLRAAASVPSMAAQLLSGNPMGILGAVGTGKAGLAAANDFAGNLSALGAMMGSGGFSGGSGGLGQMGSGNGSEVNRFEGSVLGTPAYQQLQRENPQLAAQIASYEQTNGIPYPGGSAGGNTPYGMLQQMAMGQDPGLTRNLGQIDKYFSDVAANQRRQMGGQYQYGGGLPQKTMETVELNRARAKSGALADDRSAQFQRLMSASGLGLEKDKLAQAAKQFQEQMGLSRDQFDANIAAGEDAAQSNMWGNIGNTAGNLLNMWMSNETNPFKNWFSGSDNSVGSRGGLTDWRTYAPSGGSSLPVIGEYGTTAFGM